METTTQNPKQVSKTIIDFFKDELLILKIKGTFKRKPSKEVKMTDTLVSYSFYDFF